MLKHKVLNSTIKTIRKIKKKEVALMASNSLKLPGVSSTLSSEECSELESNINRIIEAHKSNRQEINRLVFESVVYAGAKTAAARILNRT